MHHSILVPPIITIDGVKIMIFADDHNPPYFHARYGEHVAQVRIAYWPARNPSPSRAGGPLGQTDRRIRMSRRIAVSLRRGPPWQATIDAGRCDL